MRKTCIVMVGLAVALAGCGDDGGSDNPDGSDKFTKAQYIARGDAICREFRAARRQYDRDVDALPDDARVEDLAPIFGRGVAAAEVATKKFRALPIPGGDEAELGAYLDGQAQGLRLTRRIQQAAADGSLAKVQKIIKDNEQEADRQDQRAKGYGFEVCGTD
ncbi:MAG: hypothetical protein ACRDLS_16760 [Solirubrobacteraceae bacterium]